MRRKEERVSSSRFEAHIEGDSLRTYINPAGPNSAPMKSQKNFL